MKPANEINKDQYAKALKKAAREKWEREFAKQLDAMEWTYRKQYKFHADRDWRFDIALNTKFYTEVNPENWILVDIQGGIWSGGAHVRGLGYKNDIEKMNAATAMGYQVYWFTSGMVESGEAIKFIQEVVFNE